tara:strand:- start:1425 stop:1592 length:168 start_codon:yes stop_codon:yes gene_type:complete
MVKASSSSSFSSSSSSSESESSSLSGRLSSCGPDSSSWLIPLGSRAARSEDFEGS